MKKIFVSLLFFVALFSISKAEELTADSIIKKFYEHTGLDKFNKIKSFEIEGETQIFGDIYPFRLQYKAPNFFRWKERFHNQVVYKIINADEAKVRTVDKTVDMGNLEQDIIRNTINYMEGFLANYKTNHFKVEYDGVDDYNGLMVYVLKVTTPTDKVFKLYLDQKTFDIRFASANPFVLADIGPVHFDNYTQVDGFSFPKRTQLENQQFPIIQRFYSIKINLDFPDSFFKVDSPDNKVIEDK